MIDKIEKIRDERGMFKNVPRFLRRAVERRLADLEKDVETFDREALVNHGRLKRLHALLHIKPGRRARPTLFDQLPPDSPRAVLAELVKTNDPRKAAALVREHRIPFLLVESALGTISKPVAVALVESMEADELLSRLPLLSRRGLLTGDVRQALLSRLSAMSRDASQRFSYQKIESVVRNSQLDKTLAKAAFQLIEADKSADTLAGDTALIVDDSLSMPREGNCLSLAAGVAWRLDQGLAPEAKLNVYLAGIGGLKVEVQRNKGLDHWRKMLSVTVADIQGTSLGSAVEKLAADGHRVSRLVVVSDGYENRPPRLASALDRYRNQTGQRPLLHLVQPAEAGSQLAIDLRKAQIPFGVFTLDRHLLGLDALLAALVAHQEDNVIAQILNFSS